MHSLKKLVLGLAVVGFTGGGLYVPTAQAAPTYCRDLAWANCDPDYARYTPEWNECVAFWMGPEGCPPTPPTECHFPPYVVFCNATKYEPTTIVR